MACILLTVSIGVLLVVAACSADANLQCPTCPTVQVIRVIDGDTFDSSIGTIRLFGVDTPEKGQPCYAEAAERLEELLGSTARVQNGPRLVDRYGRLLRYMYTESGQSIDETLIREGLATAWTRDGQNRDYLVGTERQARARGAGCLW